jgi:hypothetical protein
MWESLIIYSISFFIGCFGLGGIISSRGRKWGVFDYKYYIPESLLFLILFSTPVLSLFLGILLNSSNSSVFDKTLSLAGYNFTYMLAWIILLRLIEKRKQE